MPTYEYRCAKCGCEFEQFQRMTELPLQRCPKCRGRVRRLISGGSGVIFKGSGFYINDYARKGKSDKASVEETPSKPVKKEDSSKRSKD
jgi:putative FmdB family regulatory protein